MPIKDRLNALKSHYPDVDILVLTLVCHFRENNVDLGKECKEKLDVCNNYRDIAQIVVRPLYVNCVIDDITAKNKYFIKALLALTSYGNQGKYRSAYYHIKQMLNEDEVIAEHKKVWAAIHSKAKSAESSFVESPSEETLQIVIVAKAGRMKETLSILKGMQNGDMIQIVSVAPNRNARFLDDGKTNITIMGKSTNLIRAIKQLGSFGIVNKKQYEVNRMSLQRKYAPIQRRKFFRPIPSHDIVVQLPPELSEPKVYHVLTEVPGVKLKLRKLTQGRTKNPFDSKAIPSTIIVKR